MSGLYNAIFGKNEKADLLLKILGIDQPDGKFPSGRFRDIYVKNGGERIILYTRNGGGNREEYQEIFDNFKENHRNFIGDWDDGFDSTYAYALFSVPNAYKKQVKELFSGEEPQDVGEKFQQLSRDLQADKKTEATERALNVGKKIFGQMEEKEGGVIVIDEEDGTAGEKK